MSDIERNQLSSEGSKESNVSVSRPKQLDEVFCSSCGEAIKKEAEICVKCGVRQKSSGKDKNRTVAALLAFFLGSFGAHKFYLGQTGRGILYVVFFWTFIPGIIAFVEFIMLLVMSDQAFEEKYCKKA